LGLERCVHLLLISGLALSTVLLLKFALDFSEAYPALTAPFWGLVVSALGVGVANVFAPGESKTPATAREERTQNGLLATIPLGFLVSSLDCTGLAVTGCSPFCTFIKMLWTPLLAGVCLAYARARREIFLLAITAMSFVPLLPHCICYNAVNAWWIDRLGASPDCYAWGFVIGMLSVSALLKGARLWPSLIMGCGIIGGGLGFFIGHHYFHFPW